MGRIRDTLTGLFLPKGSDKLDPLGTVRETVKRLPPSRPLTLERMQGLMPAAERAARMCVIELMGKRTPGTNRPGECVAVFGTTGLQVRVTVTVEEHDDDGQADR